MQNYIQGPEYVLNRIVWYNGTTTGNRTYFTDYDIKYLTTENSNLIPKVWGIGENRIFSGQLLDWLPRNIDDGLFIEDILLLFHGSTVSLIKLCYKSDTECPKGIHKYNIIYNYTKFLNLFHFR